MKLLFATGGTAGHINPALAVASYLREKYPEAEFLFVGTADHMESRLVPAAGFDFKTIQISGFRRSFSPAAIAHNVRTVAWLMKSEKKCKQILTDFQPDVVVGFGGYVSGPVLQQAVKLGIPTCIHEQNAYPGITNKTLAKTVDRVMLTVEDAAKHLTPKKSAGGYRSAGARSTPVCRSGGCPGRTGHTGRSNVGTFLWRFSGC